MEGNTCIRRIRTVDSSNLTRGLDSSKVHRLENFFVELTRILTLEWKSHAAECIGETLNTDANRAVSHVRISRFFDRIKVDIDNPV